MDCSAQVALRKLLRARSSRRCCWKSGGEPLTASPVEEAATEEEARTCHVCRKDLGPAPEWLRLLFFVSNFFFTFGGFVYLLANVFPYMETLNCKMAYYARLRRASARGARAVNY